MNEDTLKGQWTQIKGRVREQWGKLTNDDLDQIQGRAEQLIGKVQERYGIQRDEAKRQVDDFLRTRRADDPTPILSNETTTTAGGSRKDPPYAYLISSISCPPVSISWPVSVCCFGCCCGYYAASWSAPWFAPRRSSGRASYFAYLSVFRSSPSRAPLRG